MGELNHCAILVEGIMTGAYQCRGKYVRQYVHKLLVNRLFKPAQENVWLSEMTVPQ